MIVKSLEYFPKVNELSLISVTTSIIYPKKESEFPLEITLGIFTWKGRELRILAQSPANSILKKEKNFKDFKKEKIENKEIYYGYEPPRSYFPYKGEKITWIEENFIFTLSLEDKESKKEKKKLIKKILTSKSRIDPKRIDFIRELPKIKGCELPFISFSSLPSKTIQSVGNYYTNGINITVHLYEGEGILEIYDQLFKKIKTKKEEKNLITGSMNNDFCFLYLDKKKKKFIYLYVNKKFKRKAERVMEKILQRIIG